MIHYHVMCVFNSSSLVLISRWSSLGEHWPQNSRKSFHSAMSWKRAPDWW